MLLGFICSMGIARSKTAAKLFNSLGYDSRYIGIDNRYRNNMQLNYMIRNCTIIFCMEERHKQALEIYARSNSMKINGKIVILDIKDLYNYNDDDLIRILHVKVLKHI